MDESSFRKAVEDFQSFAGLDVTGKIKNDKDYYYTLLSVFCKHSHQLIWFTSSFKFPLKNGVWIII